MNRGRHRTVTEIVAVALALFFMCSCGQKEKPDNAGRHSDLVDSSAATVTRDSLVFEFVGVDSQTVFDLLKGSHQVKYKSSALGVFITAIDSIENSNGIYWVYSVNDSMPKVACDKFVTENGDKIKWHFRKTSR